MKLKGVLRCPAVVMLSSLSCCSALEEPLRLDGFENGSVHDFTSDVTERGAATTRRKREFTPEEQKDDTYWLKRSRNNESAKRSRLRRRMGECLLEARAAELLRENEKLKAALSAVHRHNVKNHFTSRDAYLADLPAAFPGSEHLSPYAFGRRAPVQGLGPAYDPGMDNFAPPNILVGNAMENIYQRDSPVPFHFRIPACRGGTTCPPTVYEMCRREGLQSPLMNFCPNSYSAPFSLVVPADPSRAEPSSSCAARHVQVPETCATGSGPFISQAKETGNKVRVPVLPHKLRYKVSKAWREDS